MGSWYGTYEDDKQVSRKGWIYYVKWKGYGVEDAEWSAADNLRNVSSLIKAFKHAYPEQCTKDYFVQRQDTNGFVVSVEDALKAAASCSNSTGSSFLC